MRLPLTIAVVVSFPGAAVAQVVLDVPASYPTIALAVAAAQPGDVVQIAAGTYAPFSCHKAITITAAPGALVSVREPTFLGHGAVIFSIPTGGLAKVQGLQFRNHDSAFTLDVVVTGGRVAFENCWLEGEPYGDAGLKVTNAAVWLRACRCTGQLTSGPIWSGGSVLVCSGLVAENSFVVAIDTEFLGARMLPDGWDGGGDGIRATNSSVHLVRCTATGGASLSLGGFYPNGHGMRVINGVGTWLADVTLAGGSHFWHPNGGDALHNAGAVPVHLTRVTTIPGAGTSTPGNAIVGPVLADTALGLATATVDPLLGAAYGIDYLTTPNTLIGLFLSDHLTPAGPVVTVEPTWVPGVVPFVGFLVTDALGVASFQTVIPSVAALRYASFWLHAAAWPGPPLHAAPPIGGVLR